MSYGTPYGGYGPPGGYTGGQPGAQPVGEPPTNYLWMNILGIFGCTVIGIIGLVFALQVSNKWQIGDFAGAESAANTAKILGIIGLVCFILHALFWVVYIGIVVVAIGASTATL